MEPELMTVDKYCELCSEFERDYEANSPDILRECEDWFCVDGEDMALACREMRLIAGWSQKRLATAIELSEWQVRDRESGRVEPDTGYCKLVYDRIGKAGSEKIRRAIKGLRAYFVVANIAGSLAEGLADTEENVSRMVNESAGILSAILPSLTVEEYANVLKVVTSMILARSEDMDGDVKIAGKYLSLDSRWLARSQFIEEAVDCFLSYPE